MMQHSESHGGSTGGSPAGPLITIDDLPPRFNRRWSAEQREQLLAAIDGGLLTSGEAAKHYALSLNDLTVWRGEQIRPIELLSKPFVDESTVDHLSRLIAVLVEKGVLDSWDVASISLRAEAAMSSRITAFLTDDRPIC